MEKAFSLVYDKLVPRARGQRHLSALYLFLPFCPLKFLLIYDVSLIEYHQGVLSALTISMLPQRYQ